MIVWQTGNYIATVRSQWDVFRLKLTLSMQYMCSVVKWSVKRMPLFNELQQCGAVKSLNFNELAWLGWGVVLPI